MGLPLTILTAAGQQSLGLVASLGGLAALYCAALRRIDRMHVRPLVVIGLVIAAVAGVTCSGSLWLTIGCLTVIAAVAVLQIGNSRRMTTIRAVQRVLGTMAGVVFFGAIVVISPSGAWLVLTIMLLQLATEIVVTRNYALALVFITPLALMIATTGNADSPLVSVMGRIVGTLLGATIALAVFLGHQLVHGRRSR